MTARDRYEESRRVMGRYMEWFREHYAGYLHEIDWADDWAKSFLADQRRLAEREKGK